jgi:hypothetical protein
VNEPKVPRASPERPEPTFRRGVPTGAVAYDAMGRRVLNLRSGVYFLTVYGARHAVHARKVLIQR